MKVVIRADASVEIGTGHVMRCLTLAEELKKRGHEVAFACVPVTGHMIEIIRQKGYFCYELETVLSEVPTTGDLLVVDHYQLDATWEIMRRQRFSRIFVIDDLYNRLHDCDALLDYNLHATQADDLYKLKLVRGHNTEKLYGPSYVVLNDKFNQIRTKVRIRKGPIENVLIAFGGSDPTNETEKAIQAVVKWQEGKNSKIDVVVGSSNPKREIIRKLCDKYAYITYHQQVDYMAKLMLQADLSIGAGGVMTWERYAMGLPAITIAVADNQILNLKLGNAEKSLIYLGWHDFIAAKDICQAIGLIEKQAGKLTEVSCNAALRVDGKGCTRVVDVLEHLR